MFLLNRLTAEPGTLPAHRDRKVVSIAVGLIALFLVVGGSFGVSRATGYGDVFFSVYSAVVVVCCPAALLLAICGWPALTQALAAVVRPPHRPEQVEQAVTFFEFAAAFALSAGFVSTVSGLMVLLTELSRPEHLGAGMARALVSQLYAGVVAVVCIGIAAMIARRNGRTAALAAMARRSAGTAGLTVVVGTLTTLIAFGIMMLARSPAL